MSIFTEILQAPSREFVIHMAGDYNAPVNALFRADRPSYAAIQYHADWISKISPAMRQRALDALEDDDRGSCGCHD